MNQQSKGKLLFLLEFMWWIFTAIIVFAVLYPILSAFDQFPFLWQNILFIVVFITLTRYIFLLKHTFLAPYKVIKIIFFFASIPFVFFLVSQLHGFQVFLDEQGQEVLFGQPHVLNAIDPDDQINLMSYIRKEMLFFGVGSIIVAVLWPFRMLISVWRMMNRGTV